MAKVRNAEPTVICSLCGATCIAPAGSCTTGYGVTTDGQKVCFPCCEKLDREHLTQRIPTGVYLASDLATVTNWPGGVLGRVVSSKRVCKRLSPDPIYAIRVVDVHGGQWYGRGSASCALLLRPAKH